LRASVEAAYGRLVTEPEGAADELLAVAQEAVPTFEAFEDDRSLARVWLLTGYVVGGMRGRHAAQEAAEERALAYYRRTAFPTATCLQQLAGAIYWGPTPVPLGISRCTELSGDATIGIFGRASILPLVGGLHAQLGEFATARELIDEAEYELTELGASGAVAVFCGAARSDVELLAGDLDAAEAMLRDQCEYFDRTRMRIALAARAAKLAETLYRHGRLDDAEKWATVSRANIASDDTTEQLRLLPVEAKLLARKGSTSDALQLADAAVRLADDTDGLNVIASTRLARAAVLRLADLDGEAEEAIRDAIALYEQKGNVVAAAQARDLLDLQVIA
jgi:tetratricopeptide (TPR) repeat protein